MARWKNPLHVESRLVELPLSLPALFERGRFLKRAFYLRSPEGDEHPFEEILGLGCVWEASLDDEAGFAGATEQFQRFDLPKEVSEHARLLLFGAFDPTMSAAEDRTWEHFSRRALYLPELLLLRNDEGIRAVSVTLASSALTSLETWLERLTDTSPAPTRSADARQLPGPFFDLHGERERFLGNVYRFVRAPKGQKIVYARRAVHTSPPKACDALLDSLNSRFDSCATFALSPHPGAPVFVGATPETLVSCRRNRLHTVALAGTTRGKSAPDSPERAQAEAELLESPKDLDEHYVVVRMISESLVKRGFSGEYGTPPRIRRLANVSHLETPIKSYTSGNFGLLDAVDTLHPTPAVCGQPREATRERIAKYEGFDRGLYAGPIGAMSPRGDGRVFVALRCGLIQEQRALLFAGAGITPESDPEVEWAETNQKLEAIQSALDGEGLT
ncbi:isochorismate synthase [Lujinxingia vulgaris]|uniref:isochorismate synthase n=1 Tax=Lujinxingia vulgaris TaxID=2600176 RepID=UPI001E658796|nr:isochorismate synthase [Lujinxingia vulgaris]